MEPRWLEPIVVAGNVHAFTGHVDLAIAEYQRALAIEPTFGLANHFLGRAYLAKGDHGRAIQQLRKSNELLGRHDEALDWIERAADERQVGYYMPSVDPIYDSIRSLPRFLALLRRMNLEG